jgi:hypothetical protein
VNLPSSEDYANLSEERRPAHLVFWYESEVQNGGHLQCFENRGRTAQEYSHRAPEEEFSTYDLRFGECAPCVVDCPCLGLFKF